MTNITIYQSESGTIEVQLDKTHETEKSNVQNLHIPNSDKPVKFYHFGRLQSFN